MKASTLSIGEIPNLQTSHLLIFPPSHLPTFCLSHLLTFSPSHLLTL
ncbi:hypothetical protein D1AOALGA4SA_4516 [Olavius algarvensis Delta 1 endosymbiont]|nr:hypothetical protein D1AOALGA4SA_4516 [Olavius algarvensis Delta 1 endosymbiont]